MLFCIWDKIKGTILNLREGKRMEGGGVDVLATDSKLLTRFLTENLNFKKC